MEQTTNQCHGIIQGRIEHKGKSRFFCAIALKLEYTNECVGLNVLTDEEAYLNQIEIEEIKMRRDYRTSKITEKDDLLAA